MTSDDMVIISMYLREHSNLPVSVEHAKGLRPLSPITQTELDHFFYPDESGSENAAESNPMTDRRNRGAITSVSLKVSELENMDSSYDYEHAAKNEIKEHILDCLDGYFDRNVSVFIRCLSCLSGTSNWLEKDTLEKIKELAEQEGYC